MSDRRCVIIVPSFIATVTSCCLMEPRQGLQTHNHLLLCPVCHNVEVRGADLLVSDDAPVF